MSTVDDMFSRAGFVVALERGIEPTVYLTDSILSGVTLSRDDLRCERCENLIDLPNRKPASYVAINAVLRDGRCLGCGDEAE